MYVQPGLAENRTDRLHGFIQKYPFAAFIVQDQDGIEANHIPFVLKNEPGGPSCLHGHVARSNPVWKCLDGEAEALVIFQGPQSYISPNWYASRHTHGRVAPSWNYAVVHIYGTVRAIEDPVWIQNHLGDLTEQHEHNRATPWSLAEAPSDYIENAAKYVVGVEISITKIQGKFQASQQYKGDNKKGVIEGLRGEGTDNATALADIVEGLSITS